MFDGLEEHPKGNISSQIKIFRRIDRYNGFVVFRPAEAEGRLEQKTTQGVTKKYGMATGGLGVGTAGDRRVGLDTRDGRNDGHRPSLFFRTAPAVPKKKIVRDGHRPSPPPEALALGRRVTAALARTPGMA